MKVRPCRVGRREAKGHTEGGKRPDSFSCSLQRNVLCGMVRVPAASSGAEQGTLGPLSQSSPPPSPHYVGVSQHTQSEQAGRLIYMFHNEKYHSWQQQHLSKVQKYSKHERKKATILPWDQFLKILSYRVFKSSSACVDGSQPRLRATFPVFPS